MQSLHRGSFCAQDGEKSDGAPMQTRRDIQQGPWNFSPYLHIVYHKAL